MDTMDFNDKITILVVDDIPDTLAEISELLKDYYHVKVANNGEKALEIVAADHQLSLILLDIMMPGMDGYEVCQRLKADPKTQDIPVIFLSAKVEMADKIRGLELGAVDYISKPLSPPIALARIKTHLALKAAFDSLHDKNAALELLISNIDYLRDKDGYIEYEVSRRIALSGMPPKFPLKEPIP